MGAERQLSVARAVMQDKAQQEAKALRDELDLAELSADKFSKTLKENLAKAAQELGFVNSGVAKVRVEIMENESRIYASKNSKKNSVRKANKAKVEKVQRKVIPSEEDEQNSYEVSNNSTEDNSILKDKPVIIQVGAFGDHRNAKSLTEKLSEFKAYIERIFIDNKYLYRVRIGPLSNLDLAKSIKSKLFELGHTSSHLVVN